MQFPFEAKYQKGKNASLICWLKFQLVGMAESTRSHSQSKALEPLIGYTHSLGYHVDYFNRA